MGEGDGCRDVTDEIEDDAQLEGTKGEEQDGKKEPPEAPKDGEEDTAREVGFDLDVEAQAQPEQETKDGQQPPEKNDEEDLDRERGDVDLNAGGKLDDKLWNGEDEQEEKDDEQKPGDAEEQGEEKKGQQENIEAHGAQGEGEAEMAPADNTGEEGKDEKKKNDATDKNKDGKKDEEGQNGEEGADPKQQEKEEEKAQQEEGVQNKTPWEEQDQQFDVNMQQPKGEGQGDEQQDEEGGEGDAQDDLMGEGDLDLDEDGEGERSSDGGGGSDRESRAGDVADPDEVNATSLPQEPQEADEPDKPQEPGVEPCVGDGEHPPDEPDEQKGSDAAQAQNANGDDKAPEPPREGEPASSSDKNEAAPESSAQEQMFGGSSGAATSFETKPEEEEKQNGEASTGAEQGGKSSAMSAGSTSKETPSAKPDKAGAGGQNAQPSPQEKAENGDAPERHLQKVDILRGAEEGEKAGAEEQKAGAEKGLHLADPKEGAEALGECKDATAADQALGVSQKEGEEGEAAAMEEDEEPETSGDRKGRALEEMRLQNADEDMTPKEPKLKGAEAGQEESIQAMDLTEGTRGGSTVASTTMPNMLPPQGAGPEDEGAGILERADVDVVSRRRRPEHEVRQLWSQLERCTAPLAAALCEQLRTILEPTLKGRLQGFYRTGKRISMRRVIPFIASNYRRDKIWLRRTKPSKREYQIVVAIDNSRSMSECGVGPMALPGHGAVGRRRICRPSLRERKAAGVVAFGCGATPCSYLRLGAGRPSLVRVHLRRGVCREPQPQLGGHDATRFGALRGAWRLGPYTALLPGYAHHLGRPLQQGEGAPMGACCPGSPAVASAHRRRRRRHSAAREASGRWVETERVRPSGGQL